MTAVAEPELVTTPDGAASVASARALITCWLRETDGWQYDPGGQVMIPLSRWNARLIVGVDRWSPTFRPRLRMPAEIQIAGQALRPVDTGLLAALLADELDTRFGVSPTLLPRVLDSAEWVAASLAVRAAEVDRLWSAAPLRFGESEQALLLGHAAHPTPKSRGELGADQRARYSPEVAAEFRLRWLAVDPGIVRHASALDATAPVMAEALLRRDPHTDRAELDAALRVLGGERRVLVPAHPFQLERMSADPQVSGFLDDGTVLDLGAWGSGFRPTTSVRTVYSDTARWQLKFSLHARITNSMRVLLPKELDRAVEAARLARTEVGAAVAATAPQFVLVQDPAYLAIAPGGVPIDGLSVLFRENRWASGGPADVSALTTLCQDHPFGGDSRLVAIVDALAAGSCRGAADVAREWFARFADVVVRSLVRLYGDVGLCFEAHQQNTLVELEGGWPVRGVYRDSQGYFHRAAAHADLAAVIPGLGEATVSIFEESLADERLAYYLFTNLTLGVINALGDRVDESLLLADLRRLLEDERSRGGRYPLTLLDRLLDDPTWPCKANLLTRAHDMDELVGDIAEQSVYVRLPNPLTDPLNGRSAGPSGWATT